MEHKESNWDKAREIVDLLEELGLIVELKAVSKDMLCYERFSLIIDALEKVEREAESLSPFCNRLRKI